MKQTNYDINDIKRYVNGEMNSAERHALELAALNDPFLADALEGYMLADANKAASDNAFIRDAIKEEKKENKVVPLFTGYKWLSAAAVVIVIGGAAWLTFTLMNKPSEELAENKVQPAATQKTTALTDSAAPIKELRAEHTQALNQIQKKFKENNIRDRIVKQQADMQAKKEADAAVHEPPAMNSETPPVVVTATAPVQKRSFSAQSAAVTENARNNASDYSISGYVKDEKNKPVPGATIQIDNRSLLTNNAGYFTFPAADSNKLARISVVGMYNKEVRLKPGVNTIQLETAHQSLSEIVVTGAASKRQKMNNPGIHITIDTVNVYPPTEGWEYFRERMKLFLADAQLYESRGVATVSFDIIKNGSLRRIRIENTTNNELAEAITEFLESDDFFTYTPDRIRLAIQIR